MGEKIRTLENCNEVCMCEGSNTVTYYDDPCLEGGCEVKDGQVQCINSMYCNTVLYIIYIIYIIHAYNVLM